MKGLPRRIPLRRRTSDPVSPETQPTIVAPEQAPPPSEPLPAGVSPEDVAPSRPSFRDRGRLRRRLRYLRRVRELGFRDLGGLVFDLHRFGRRNDELVLGKLAALDAVDRELRAIERVLDERRDIVELREPGVAACPRCGALHGSDAKFCPQCGTQFSGPLAMVEVGGTTATPPEATPPHVVAPPPEDSSELATTPVSGALAGGTPVAPPADQPTAAMPAVTAQDADADTTSATRRDEPTPAGDPSGTAPAAGDQPPAADDPGTAPPGNGTSHDDATTSASITSGDPLAPRERPDA